MPELPADTVERAGMGPLFPIFVVVFVDVLALTLVLPLLPYYAQHFGASPLVVGALFACFSACQLVSGPLLGRLSDRFGRKPVLIVSQLGTLVGLLVMGLADRLELLFLGRIIDGMTAGNLSIAQAYIADVTRPENRTRAFGFFGIAFGVGFLVGPALSGVLAARYGYAAPPLAAAGLSAVSIVLSSTLLPGGRPSVTPGARASLVDVLRHEGSRSRILELFGFVFSFAMLTGGLAMFLERRLQFGVEEVGYTFGFSGLVGALTQGGIGRAAKSLGEWRLSAGGLVLMVAGFLVLSQAHQISVLLVALGLLGVGSAVVRPALTTLLTQAVEEGNRGGALGVAQSASSLGQGLGPALAGFLIHHRLLSGWALAAAALATGVLAVRWLSRGGSA